MNQTIMDKEALLKLVEEIARSTYAFMETLPESEQWDQQSRLRNHAVEAVSVIGEAAGTLDPRDARWRLGQGRGCLFSLKSLIKLAHDTNDLELDPELMVAIERALKTIDSLVEELSPQHIKQWLADTYPSSEETKK